MSNLLAASLLGVVWLATPTAGREDLRSTSADDAHALVARLEGRQLQTFAARIPDTPNRYAAVMKAGPMLLVVGAAYSQPVLLNEQIWRGEFEAVYRELNTGADREGKLFVQDMSADGLRPHRATDGAFDVVFESVVNRIAFNGDWKGQQRSREEYERAFTEFDRRYAQLLRTLIAALDAPSAATTTRE